MNILYLIDQYKPEYYTGTIKFAENIIKEFSKGNNVVLVSYSDKVPEDYSEFEDVRYWNEVVDNVKCIKFNLIEQENDINYSLYNETIYKFSLKIINEINPDFIHICHPRRVASFIQGAIKLKKKYIITFTDSFMICPNFFLFTNSCELCKERHKKNICNIKCSYNEEIINSNRIKAKEYIEMAYELVAPSKFQAEIYEEFFDRDIMVINHGNELKCISDINKVYPKKKLIFGFNGNSSTLKGLNVAIEAFNLINEEFGVELHVYGSCDDTSRSLAGKNVKFFGRYKNSEVENILRKVDCLICPSIGYESYSFVLTEALINRVPVIATNEGAMKELVKNCVNGFTFTLGDSGHLAQIIKYIYNDQSILIDFRENLKNYKINKVEDEVAGYLKIYKSCLIDEKNIERRYSIIENMWTNILEKRYKIDIDYYFKIIDKNTKKYKYLPKIDAKYRFIARILNMESTLKQKRCKEVVIWGSGTSGKITIEILTEIFNWLKISFILDKYEVDGDFNGIKIKNVSVLENEDFEYLFICTSPGKEEAENVMKRKNKIVNYDYSYGFCIE